VPASFASETLTAPYNNIEAVRRHAERFGKDIACIIVEPVAANMGVVLPENNFLKGLRKIADQIGAVLIFDEVITGFRVALGGAQELYGVKPDLTTLGKIIGGGLPIGAFGGRRKIMEELAPMGPVYQAGTLSGNPLAASAGIAVLKYLIRKNPYPLLDKKTFKLVGSIKDIFKTSNDKVQINQVGSMFTIFFSGSPISDYATAKLSNTSKYAAFFKYMLNSGILLPPSQFETVFVSTAHNNQDIRKIIDAVETFIK